MFLRNPRQWARVMDALTDINVDQMKKGRFLPLYQSGTVYRTEPGTEIWQTRQDLHETKVGDCEDLACTRSAEYRLAGVPAKPRTYRTGAGRHHAIVALPGGKREDPSVICQEIERKAKKVRVGMEIPQTVFFDIHELPDGKGWKGKVTIRGERSDMQIMGFAGALPGLLSLLSNQGLNALTPSGGSPFDLTSVIPGFGGQAKGALSLLSNFAGLAKKGVQKLKKGWKKFKGLFHKKKKKRKEPVETALPGIPSPLQLLPIIQALAKHSTPSPLPGMFQGMPWQQNQWQ